MERRQKIEVIQKEIEQLIQQEQDQYSKRSSEFLDDSFVKVDNNTTTAINDAQHRHQILSQLSTQLESLKEDTPLDEMDQSTNLPESPTASKVEKVEEDEDEEKQEKIVKELKKIQKQNFITQCLLSAMIVLTLTWQLSEVSIILKLKDGLNHPFRSVGSMISGWIKGPQPVSNGHEHDLNDSAKQIKRDLNDSAKQIKQQVAAMSLPTIKIPELPHVELPSLDFIHEED